MKKRAILNFHHIFKTVGTTVTALLKQFFTHGESVNSGRLSDNHAEPVSDNGDVLSCADCVDYEEYLSNQVKIYLQDMGILNEYHKYIDRNKIAIDIGANRGELSWFLLEHACKVIAFEPLPSAFQQLSRISSDKLEIHNLALSNRVGTSILKMPFDTAMNSYNDGLSSLEPSSLNLVYSKFPNRFTHEKELTTQTQKLDNFCLSDVTTIKIDVEGHEIEVLEGAKNTILSNKPSLLIEIAWNKRGTNECVRIIQDLGYKGYFFEDGCLKPIHLASENEFNFLFLPDGG